MEVDVSDGRIYIPKDVRRDLGERFHLVRKGDRLVLIPVSSDPLEALRQNFSDVDKSVDELKKEALEEAKEQAGR